MIATFTGRLVNPLNLKDSDIDILDIAHSLAMTCRYRGHCTSFYSVAQHSVLVSRMVPCRLRALLHDAAEAYLCNIPGPEKHRYLINMGSYCVDFGNVEIMILSKIYRRFKIPDPDIVADAAIGKADLAIRGPEMNALMRGESKIVGSSISSWTWQESESRFLEAFQEYSLRAH